SSATRTRTGLVSAMQSMPQVRCMPPSGDSGRTPARPPSYQRQVATGRLSTLPGAFCPLDEGEGRMFAGVPAPGRDARRTLATDRRANGTARLAEGVRPVTFRPRALVRLLERLISRMFEIFTEFRMSIEKDPTPARVLVADDQPDVLEALRWLLSGEGYQAQFVSSTDGVMERLPAEEFDLLLMDLNYTRDTTSGR